MPAVAIEDAPRFRWRGMMIDSARYFQPVGYLKQFIDVMAQHKLNVFHRNAETGALTPLKTYDCGKGPAWVMSVKFD